MLKKKPEERPSADRIIKRVRQLLPVDEDLTRINMNADIASGQRIFSKLIFTHRSGANFKRSIFIQDIETSTTQTVTRQHFDFSDKITI